MHTSHSDPACMGSGSLLGVSLGFGFSHEAGSAWEKSVHVSWSYSQWGCHVCVQLRFGPGRDLGWEYAHVSYS